MYQEDAALPKSKPIESSNRSHQLLEQILAEQKETNRNLGILAKAMLTLSAQFQSAANWVEIDNKNKKVKKTVDKV